MMQRFYQASVWVLLSLGLMSAAYADDASAVVNPVTLVQSSISTLQAQISQGGAVLQNQPRKIAKIMGNTIMPLVNVDQMAGLALGPKWRTADPATRKAFVDEFTLLLSKNYANAILEVVNYKISLNPLRGDAWKTAATVQVTGRVTSETNGSSSVITYYLERSGNSWQIYDFAVEGVSFLKNYQAQFQSFSDMNSLMAKLVEMNSGA
jgi:phospholipid transport system substrate-binding protein